MPPERRRRAPKAASGAPTYVGVANKLRDDILGGRLEAGEWLPSEAGLAEQLAVSRSTVREALRILSSERLVTTSRGVYGGTQVARLGQSEIAEMIGVSVALLERAHECSIEERIEMREHLEVKAAGLAAKRRSEEQLQALREAIPEAGARVTRQRNWELGSAFHERVLSAAGNRLLHVLTEPILALSQPAKGMGGRPRSARAVTQFLATGAPDEFWDCVHADHASILEAIEEGDEHEASARMAAHLGRLNEVYSGLGAPKRASVR